VRGRPVDKFELLTRIVIKDFPEFTKVSMDFHFKIPDDPGERPHSILFAK